MKFFITKRKNLEIKNPNSNLNNPLSNLELELLLNESTTELGGLYV
tara:strand:+ start:805 stop:942 length:138 start_codon:yes stop_codon:yes gene_type:complete